MSKTWLLKQVSSKDSLAPQTLFLDAIPQSYLKDKVVMVRVDYNVPTDKNGEVSNDKRIRASFPTLEFLQKAGAKIVLMSHKGRPQGKFLASESLQPVARKLEKLLNQPVRFTGHIGDDFLIKEIGALKAGEILMVENLRFKAEEEDNDLHFAKKLAQAAHFYVNDAFGTAHRAHASTAGITRYIPAIGGFLMQQEIENLSRVLLRPQAGFTAIVGGAKVSDKFEILKRLVDRVETLVIGGAMANTFLKARGIEMGKSLVEGDRVIEEVKAFLKLAENKGVNVILPVDFAVAATSDPRKLSADQPRKTVSADGLSANEMALDIGEISIQNIEEVIAHSQTVLWNGPMGYFEHASFNEGTLRVAQATAAQKTRSDWMSVVGGGDSVTAIENAGIPEESFTWVSTGGGASLEFLEGKTLPGVKALIQKGIIYRYLKNLFSLLLRSRYWYLLQ